MARDPAPALPRSVEGLLRRLRLAAAASGQRIWLTGGYLRDNLLCRMPKPELDFTVAAPRPFLAALRLAPHESAFALDEERDTFRIVFRGGGAIEHVDLTKLRAATIEEDLALRDFTMNALAAELVPGEAGPLLDPTGGVADSRRRRLRACGTRSIADDPLRALRGVRFAATLGLHIEPVTLRLMARARRALREVSRERVRDELFQILRGPRPAWGIALALRLGLLEGVGVSGPPQARLARLRRADRVVAALPARGELRRALDERLEQGVTRLGLLRLAALFRNLRLERRAAAICSRLLLGNRAARCCVTATGRALPSAWYRDPKGAPRAGLLDLYAAADHAAAEILILGAPSAESARSLWARYGAARRIFRRAPLLTGAIAMRELRLPPGPALGRLLAAAKRAQDLGSFRSPAAALAWARASDAASPAPSRKRPPRACLVFGHRKAIQGNA